MLLISQTKLTCHDILYDCRECAKKELKALPQKYPLSIDWLIEIAVLDLLYFIVLRY